MTSSEVLVLHPSFWLLRVLFRLATCRPNGFGPSHRLRRRAIVDPSIRSQDMGRRNRASEISPRFLRHGRSHRSRTIDGNGKLFGRPRGIERVIIGLLRLKRVDLRGLRHRNMMGAIIPALMHRIPSELRN